MISCLPKNKEAVKATLDKQKHKLTMLTAGDPLRTIQVNTDQLFFFVVLFFADPFKNVNWFSKFYCTEYQYLKL